MVFPEIIKTIKSLGKHEQIIVAENADSLKTLFFNSPSRENLDNLWEPLEYQNYSLKEYDLFPYEWYAAFTCKDKIALHTLRRMLVDTIFDKNHFIPNSSIIEFANQLESENKTMGENIK